MQTLGPGDAVEKAGLTLLKPLVARDHEREGPTACCGRGEGRKAGGFQEGEPCFFNCIAEWSYHPRQTAVSQV